MYLTSNNALRALKEILVCLRLQSLLERLNYSRKIRCYRDVGSTCHYLHGGQIALCEQSVQGLNHKILKTKIVAKQLSGCALVISKFGAGRHGRVAGQDKNVTHSARPRLRESAGSDYLSASSTVTVRLKVPGQQKSQLSNIKLTSGDLGVFPQLSKSGRRSGSGSRPAGHRPAAGLQAPLLWCQRGQVRCITTVYHNICC